MFANLFLCTKEKPKMWTSRLGRWLSEWRTQVQTPSPHIKSRVQLVSVIQSALAKSQLDSVGSLTSDKARSDRKKLWSLISTYVYTNTHTHFSSIIQLKMFVFIAVLHAIDQVEYSTDCDKQQTNFYWKGIGFCQHNTNESAEKKELYTKSVCLSDRVWVCLDVEYFISNCLHCSIRTQNQGWRGRPARSGMMKGRSVADVTWPLHSRAHSTRLGLSTFCYKR